MGYSLGIDVGTTYTAAATWDAEGSEMVSLAHDRVAVASVVALGADGLVFGDAALTATASDPTRAAREFKRRFGDETPMFLGGTPFSADLLTARLLGWTYQRVVEQAGDAPTRTVLTHPANWGRYKLDLFSQAASLAGIPNPVLLPEPVAAAVHYDQRQRVRDGGAVAVYDLGGGTFDATVLRRVGAGYEVLGDAVGIERLGGIDLDEVVFRMVQEAHEEAFVDLDPDDAQVVRAVLRLREECTRAKVNLSFDTRATVPVVLPGLQAEVLIQRAEFEARIRPLLAQTVANVEQAVKASGLGAGELDALLLVGGSSRVPLVAQMLSSGLGVPVVLDTHPKHAVALGAAAHGWAQMTPAAATAAASAGPETLTPAPERQVVPELTVDVGELRALIDPVLVVVAGASAGTVHDLHPGVTAVGRRPTEPGSLAVADVQVSRTHLHVLASPGRVDVVDAGSTNGTRLDGEVLTARATVLPGSVLEIGTTLLMVDHPGAEEPAAASLLASATQLPELATGGLGGWLLRRRREEKWRSEFAGLVASHQATQTRIEQARRLAHPPAALLARWVAARPARIGRRALGDPDVGVVTIGLAAQPGVLRLEVPAEAADVLTDPLRSAISRLATDVDVPVALRLAVRQMTSVIVPEELGRSLLRGLVLQLLALHQADVLSVVVVGVEADELPALADLRRLPGGAPVLDLIPAEDLVAHLGRPRTIGLVFADALAPDVAAVLATRCATTPAASVVWFTSRRASAPGSDRVLAYDSGRGTAGLISTDERLDDIVLCGL